MPSTPSDIAIAVSPRGDESVQEYVSDKAVEGFLWKADREQPLHIRAEGLGSAQRAAPPEGTRVTADWRDGHWQVVFEIPAWSTLAAQRQLAVAVWAGAAQERAGLKSVSPGWLPLG